MLNDKNQQKSVVKKERQQDMQIYLHQNDLPSDLDFLAEDFKGEVAVDTEAMGLKTERDRLCLVQVSVGDGNCHLVQIPRQKIYPFEAPNLRKLFENQNVLKIFHFARFDNAAIRKYLNIRIYPLFCTKIASRLARTYTDQHSLKEICKALLGITLLKEESCSDWGSASLTEAQLSYAAKDVLYLHQLKKHLEDLLIREERLDLAKSCFELIPTLALLDAQGFNADEIIRY